MSDLEIRFLGAPQVTVVGKALEVDTRKAIALLAYLVTTGQRHTRDALAALLWPEYDQTSARAALRRTLSTLNKALASDWLLIDREAVEFNVTSAVWIDVEQFQQCVAQCRQHGHSEREVCARCLPLLRAAAELYRGDFMAGFTLRDSPNFDDWQFFQTEGLRRQYAGVLERLVQGLTEQADYADAIDIARRWLQLDPLHEPAHRALMQLYAWSGQMSAALRQYRECVRILDQELGAPPLSETTELYQAISEHRQLAPPVITSVIFRDAQSSEGQGDKETGRQGNKVIRAGSREQQSAISNPQSRVVGRAQEWKTLLDAYQSIQDNGHLIALVGEAGIGKSYLADAFLDQLRTRQVAVFPARCYEGETDLAYAPWIQVLRQALNRPDHKLEQVPAHWLGEVARLLPEISELFQLSPLPAATESSSAQSRFFAGVSQTLFALLKGATPGVLFFDDLQWADTASLELLAYLARRMNGQAICVMAAWRSEEAMRQPRLRQLVVEGQRNHTATLIPLARWERKAVQELVTQSEKLARAPAMLVDRLYQETEGLPLFVAEYVAMLQQAQAQPLSEGWVLPATVHDLLQARFATISQTASQLLSAAAVIGRSFDFDTVREASGRSEDEMIVALEELLGRGLICETQREARGASPIYDFNHERLRTLVYEETSLARRRLLHRRVADALHNQARRRNQDLSAIASSLAYHYHLAGQDAEATTYAYLAGEQARQVYANREALTHFQTALAFGHPAQAALRVAIGDLQTLLGEYRGALTSYESAIALLPRAETATLEHKLGFVYHRLGEWERAEHHFRSALSLLPADDAAAARSAILTDWSLTLHRRGDLAQALALATEALAAAQAADQLQALAQAHNILGILARSQGDVATALHHAQQSLDATQGEENPAARMATLNNLALAHAAAGETAEAIPLLEEALALCLRLGDRHREAALRNNLADLLHAAGKTEQAMTQLKQAVVIFAEIGLEAGQENVEIWKLTEW